MLNLFFYSERQFENVADLIFASLGITNYVEGESSNVLGGYYYSYSVFGIDIKLEQNSYDYEDQVNYMLHIKKHSISPLNIDSFSENTLTGIILSLLYNNFEVPILVEKQDKLIKLSQDNIFEMTQ